MTLEKSSSAVIEKSSCIHELFSIITLCLTPLFYTLRYYNYGLMHVEVLFLALFFLVLSVITTIILRHVTSIVRTLFYVMLLSVVLSCFPLWQSTAALIVTTILLIPIAIYAESTLITLILVMSGTFLISLYILPLKTELSSPIIEKIPQHGRQKNLPPIIHIVLDEHIGLAGIDAALDTMEYREYLKQVLLKYGFRVYSHAYSRYSHTTESLPAEFNFTSPGEVDILREKKVENEFKMLKNRYFSRLSQAGYQLKIYQPLYLDYCHTSQAKVSQCYTYPDNSLSLLHLTTIAPQYKALLILASIYAWSPYHLLIYDIYNYYVQPIFRRSPFFWEQHSLSIVRVLTLMVPHVFETFQQEILSQPQGSVFFIHLLAPHSPYVLDAHCQLLHNPFNWMENISMGEPISTPLLVRQRNKMYFQQTHCWLLRLDYFFQRLKKAGILDSATIIVQGDHGHRILHERTVFDPTKTLNISDWRSSFSTLFAVKTPGWFSGIDASVLPLQDLLAQTMAFRLNQPISTRTTEAFTFLLLEDNASLVKYPGTFF